MTEDQAERGIETGDLVPIVPDWDLRFSGYREGDCLPLKDSYGIYELKTMQGKYRRIMTCGALDVIDFARDQNIMAADDYAISIKKEK